MESSLKHRRNKNVPTYPFIKTETDWTGETTTKSYVRIEREGKWYLILVQRSSIIRPTEGCKDLHDHLTAFYRACYLTILFCETPREEIIDIYGEYGLVIEDEDQRSEKDRLKVK